MDISDWIHDYEHWVSTVGGRPTVAILATVFTLLAAVTIPIARSPHSMRAFFWFALANSFTWNWFWWARSIATSTDRPQPPPETGLSLHVMVFVVHILIITGIGLIISMFGKYWFGWEDHPPNLRRRHDD